MVNRCTPKYQKICANAQTRMRTRRRNIIYTYKKSISCVFCDLKNPLCIDFDHIDKTKKTGTPATMICNGTSWKRVQKELKNCQPVCANCHRIKTILEAGKMQGIDDDLMQWIPEKLLRAHGISPKVSVNSS